jgi:O-6-methylguanine DNA methyltransferase
MVLHQSHFYRAFHIAHAVTDVTIVAGSDSDRIAALYLGVIREHDGASLRIERSAGLSACAEAIMGYLDGRPSPLHSFALDLDGYSDFSRAVLHAARRIPYGTTASYAQLAAMAGAPRAVRATASVMRRNRIPLLVPCHRVIRSDGVIGGFMGQAEGAAVDLKRRLLELERGVR